MKPLTPEIEHCRATVKSWERLRFLYNGILLLPGALLLWRTLFLQSEFMKAVAPGTVPFPIGDPLELVAGSLIFGLAANICYCLGPYAEFVITALGFPITGQRSRYLIFGLGAMASIGVIGCGWLFVEYRMVSSFIPTP